MDLFHNGRGLHAKALPALLMSFFIPLAIATTGCGAAPSEDPDDASSAAKKAAAAEAPKAAPGHMLRADVDRALSEGPTWILRRVIPKEVIRNGAFIGWQIVAMPEDWSGTGLKPGDVVTRVNGASIERPDDLWTTWVALMTAPELKVAYERDGAAKELVMPIDGPPTLNEEALQAKRGAQPSESGPGRRWETIVIPDSDPAQDSGEPAPPSKSPKK